jgi:aryl-alcohol dehydrogenase-like predicted oxidoreductase
MESVRAMHDLIVQGKVLYWGTSEWTAPQLAEAYAVCDQLGLHPPQMEQPQYNLFHRQRVEKELAPYCQKSGLGTTVWSPLGSGLLTGKYNQGIPPGTRLNVPGLEWLRDSLTGPGAGERLAVVRKLAAIAGELDTTLPRLALAWCLKNPQVSTVILGASRVEQLTENLGALGVIERLTPDVLKRIDRLCAPVAD